MQFVLKQGKNAEERQKKKVYGRRWIRVATACIVCAVVAGGSLIGLRRSFLMSQNETSGSAPKTETASQEESLEIGKADQGDAVSGDVDASDAQEDGTAVSNQGKEEKESSQDSAGTEENTSASTGILTQKVDIKVLAVTPTSLKVRLTNNGDEDISVVVVLRKFWKKRKNGKQKKLDE